MLDVSGEYERRNWEKLSEWCRRMAALFILNAVAVFRERTTGGVAKNPKSLEGKPCPKD